MKFTNGGHEPMNNFLTNKFNTICKKTILMITSKIFLDILIIIAINGIINYALGHNTLIFKQILWLTNQPTRIIGTQVLNYYNKYNSQKLGYKSYRFNGLNA